ncbi:MAG TPA: hypothetical protein VHS30_02555 [Streptosporangiaceae bacterium]|nr:hypothetical protein [Streptosporangiaceae bacterium]
MTASLLGAFLFGEHIRTDAAGLHQAAPWQRRRPGPGRRPAGGSGGPVRTRRPGQAATGAQP